LLWTTVDNFLVRSLLLSRQVLARCAGRNTASVATASGIGSRGFVQGDLMSGGLMQQSRPLIENARKAIQDLRQNATRASRRLES